MMPGHDAVKNVLTIVKIRLTDYSHPFKVFTIVKKAGNHHFAGGGS